MEVQACVHDRGLHFSTEPGIFHCHQQVRNSLHLTQDNAQLVRFFLALPTNPIHPSVGSNSPCLTSQQATYSP